MKPKTLVAVAAATLFAVVIGSPRGAAADDLRFMLIEGNWDAFAGSAGMGSFAWAGEDEVFSHGPTVLGSAGNGVAFDGSEVDPILLTGIPAPEPPALVLAGLAFGGVLCGRSLIMRRRGGNDTTDDGELETPRT